MTSNKKLLPALTCAMIGLGGVSALAQSTPAAPAQPAPAPAAPAAPAPGSVTVTGLVDIYFGVNGRAPSNGSGSSFTSVPTVGGGAIKVDNAGRAFDINDRELSFSLGEVNIVRTANASFPVGITATLTGGDTARLVHANEPGGTSGWQFVQQLYFTKVSHIYGRDFTFDLGKFVTPLGNEVIESSSNDNYSRSFGFTYGVPLYHAGLRIAAPISKTVTATLGLVNGWNNTADDNNGKTVFTSVAWKPTDKFSTIFNYIGGPEGTGAFGPGVPTNGGGSIGVSLGEIIPTYQVTPKLKLVGDILLGRGAGTVTGVAASGSWFGMAGYAKYQFTPKFAIATRLEQFEDMAGAGGFGIRTGAPGYTKLSSYTLTFEYTSFKDKLVSRLEYRHDHSNQAFFGSGSGAGVADQDTLMLGEVFKF